MAYLYRRDIRQRFPLLAHHIIGSLEGKVDTLFENPYVSRRHFATEWNGERWQLKDLSRNGTWINKKRVSRGQYHSLAIGDEIHLAGDEDLTLLVEDLSAPCDLLLPVHSANPLASAIELRSTHFVPNEDAPEWYLYQDPSSGQWLYQPITSDNPQSQPLGHNDVLQCQSDLWQLFRAGFCLPTAEKPYREACINETLLAFDVSLDEETTYLEVRAGGEVHNLGIRAHNYLLLHLARLRVEDTEKGLSGYNQGWIDNELLASELGIDPNHLNIHVYRARQQLAKLLPSLNHERLIERRGSQMRLGCNRFSITKGGKTEYPSFTAESFQALHPL
ncbi:FHA domain-containing protein [Marinimicrobium locisalis]|uniref:FHA domain-containing protein n=1 Tax=Marinimicrobium locisalis TaxID=546022 RepID=UPI003221F317